MGKHTYRFKSEVWLYPAENAAWHFVTVEKPISQKIKEIKGLPSRGFGSIRVEATIGKTKWNTSIFPDKRYGAYILPVKELVRRKEHIRNGDNISCTIKIRNPQTL